MTGRLHSYLANLNEQAQEGYQMLIQQRATAEGVTKDLKRQSQWGWIKAMNSIVNRAEEVIRYKMIYV